MPNAMHSQVAIDVSMQIETVHTALAEIMNKNSHYPNLVGSSALEHLTNAFDDTSLVHQLVLLVFTQILQVILIRCSKAASRFTNIATFLDCNLCFPVVFPGSKVFLYSPLGLDLAPWHE